MQQQGYGQPPPPAGGPCIRYHPQPLLHARHCWFMRVQLFWLARRLRIGFKRANTYMLFVMQVRLPWPLACSRGTNPYQPQQPAPHGARPQARCDRRV